MRFYVVYLHSSKQTKSQQNAQFFLSLASNLLETVPTNF